MKILKFKGKMSLKNKIYITVGITLAVIILTFVFLYMLNEPVREWIDILNLLL